jgi:CRP-like cAMP-binding protein
VGKLLRRLAGLGMSPSDTESITDCLRWPDAQALVGAGHPRSLRASSLLCEEGQVTDRFFLVTNGEFAVAKRIAGRRQTLSVFGPGSVLALMPALDGAPCAVSISAQSDATVVEIRASALLDLLARDGDACLRLASSLSLLAIRRLRGATNELALALCSVLQSRDCRSPVDALVLARIQAGSYAWLGD